MRKAYPHGPFSWDGTSPSPLTRRELLRRFGLGAAALATGGAIVPACSDNGGSGSPDSSSDVANGDIGRDSAADPAAEPDGPADRAIFFANWPFYLDPPAEEGGFFATSTLQDFQAESGVRVEYQEIIADNDSFYATLLPAFDAGIATGWDLAVVTDWMVAKLIRLGYLEALDHGRIGNLDNLGSAFRDPAFDRGRAYSIPWQAGFTGIAYDIDRTGRELTSVNDLFDPAFAGHVTLLASMRDTLGLIMLGLDIDPSQATIANAQAAAERMGEAIDAGQVLGVMGGEYMERLTSGEAWVSVSWSGDVLYAQREMPSLRFLVPQEGAMLWSDNLVIPRRAAGKADAEALMSFYLRPEVAAKLTSWVGYMSPIPGAQQVLRDLAEESGLEGLGELADNPLVFPDDATLARGVAMKALDDEEEQAFNEAFEGAIGL